MEQQQTQELDRRIKQSYVNVDSTRTITDVPDSPTSVMLSRPKRGEKRKSQGWLKRA